MSVINPHLTRTPALVGLVAAASLAMTALVAPAQAAGRPVVRATPVSVVESGGAAVVRVRLAKPAPRNVRVSWRTRAGTAKPGRDFRAGSGVAVIKKGSKVARIRVRIVNDRIEEPTETFHLLLASKRARVRSAKVAVRIKDDDGGRPGGGSGGGEVTALSGRIDVTTKYRSNASTPVENDWKLTLNFRPTSQYGGTEWRDPGSGTWTLKADNYTRNPGGECPILDELHVNATGTIASTWLSYPPPTGKADVVIREFYPSTATSKPFLEFVVAAPSTRTTWTWDHDLAQCVPSVTTGTWLFRPETFVPGRGGTIPAKVTGTSPRNRGLDLAFAETHQSSPTITWQTTATGRLNPVG